MTYEFIGNILSFTEKSGHSSRGEWRMWEVVLEHDYTGQFPRRVVLNVWDENVQNIVAICSGNKSQIRMLVSVDAKEFNGKWFNDLRAYRAEPVYAQPNAGYQQQYQQPMQGGQFVAPAAPAQPIPSYQSNGQITPGYSQGQWQGGTADTPF